MGKFFYQYRKQGDGFKRTVDRLEKILPVSPTQPYYKADQNQVLWINNTAGVLVNGYSLITGCPALALQDRYFSFRLDVTADEIRLFSDLVASRTAWYYSDESTFIVSSSQRMIVAALQSFEHNIEAVAWMLATGSLGPRLSWDKRIRPLPPNTVISVLKSCPSQPEIAIVSPDSGPKPDTIQEIFESVFSSFAHKSTCGVTLSGGFDSRAVLFNLVRSGIPVRAYTWGNQESINRSLSDAGIARQLATHMKVPFSFVNIYSAEENHVDVLEAFLQQGEGRIDHINSFADRMQFWRQIATDGIEQVYRADEVFGWVRTENEFDVRISLDMNQVEDYRNLQLLFGKSNLPRPTLPDDFKRKEGESLSQWRDRCYRDFRMPTILSALQDPVLPFVEIINPLLFSPFVRWASLLPDSDRDNKRAYKEYVRRLVPEVPFAISPAVPEPEDFVSNAEIRDYICNAFRSEEAIGLFGSDFVSELIAGYKPDGSSQPSWKTRVARLLPFKVKKALRRSIMPYSLSHNRIVLRAVIALRMLAILKSDAAASTSSPNG